jgi:predicted dehydrogenase
MDSNRRDFLKSGAAAALTTQIFTGNVRGANDRIAAAFIGTGKMGRTNINYALRQEDLVPVAVCDIFERNLNMAVEATNKRAKAVRDFREVLADKSIDVVCISTPDHWHAYMTVEACKAGKDVYVEKPISVTVDEGVKMVQAARKYNRVVQAGTMQRSAVHFAQAAEIVRSGQLGTVAQVRCWNYSHSAPEGIGKPADTAPPPGIDWDLWLGPAPARPFNENRLGIDPNDKYFSRFRWFWDYAGGMMTDWGVHWLDIVQWAFDEQMPQSISASGGNFYLHDNRETPDTLQVTLEYPGFIATYENRENNNQSMFEKNNGILFHGDRGTMFLDRSEFRIVPEKDSKLAAQQVKSSSSGNKEHWANFLDCVRTRKRPVSDIEKCQHSTTTCLLGNIALRSRLHIDFDAAQWTVAQPEAKKYLSRENRDPWKIVV